MLPIQYMFQVLENKLRKILTFEWIVINMIINVPFLAFRIKYH